jgi:predicted transcriptional regulator
MKNRSRNEIIAFILESVSNCKSSDGITATKIMYSAFLSYSQLKEYLALLLDKELLEYNSNTQTYKVTFRGTHYLSIHKQLIEMIVTPQQY